MNDFKTNSAEENYEGMQCLKESYPQMTLDDIADTVLSKRSRRIPGFGFGPRPEKFNSFRGASSRIREEELQSLVSAQQGELKSQGDKILTQQEELKSQGDKILTQQEELKSRGDMIKKLQEIVVKLMEDRNASTYLMSP